jgi:hypothetical protein
VRDGWQFRHQLVSVEPASPVGLLSRVFFRVMSAMHLSVFSLELCLPWTDIAPSSCLQEHILGRHSMGVNACGFLGLFGPNGVVVSAGADGTLRLWEALDSTIKVCVYVHACVRACVRVCASWASNSPSVPLVDRFPIK